MTTLRQTAIGGAIGFALAAALLFPTPTLAADAAAEPPLRYDARLVDSAIVVPFEGTTQVTIDVERFTTDSELEALERRLSERGTQGALDALTEQTLGQLRVGATATSGQPIRFARRLDADPGRHIVLIVTRETTESGLFGAYPVSKYPYLVVTLDFEGDGPGTGELIAAARLKTRQDGRVELDSPSFLSSRLLAVRPIDR